MTIIISWNCNELIQSEYKKKSIICVLVLKAVFIILTYAYVRVCVHVVVYQVGRLWHWWGCPTPHFGLKCSVLKLAVWQWNKTCNCLDFPFHQLHNIRQQKYNIKSTINHHLGARPLRLCIWMKLLILKLYDRIN